MPRIDVQAQLEAARKRIAARRQERRDRLLRRSARVTPWGTMDPFKRSGRKAPQPPQNPLADYLIVSDQPVSPGQGVYPFALVDQETRATLAPNSGVPVGIDLPKMKPEDQIKFLQGQPRENVVRWVNRQRDLGNAEVRDFRERFQSRIKQLEQLRDQTGEAAVRQRELLQNEIQKYGPVYDRLKNYKDLPPLTEEELYKQIQGGT